MEKRKTAGVRLTIPLTGFALLSIFPGARMAFVKGESGLIDSLSLAAFMQKGQLRGEITGTILTVLMVAFTGLLIAEFRKGGWDRELRRICIGFLAATLLFHSICACIGMNVYIDPRISEDALELNGMLQKEDEPALGITQRYYDDIRTYWQEAHLTKPLQQVTVEQMFVEMDRTRGIYEPFVPVDQAPNRQNGPTPKAGILVLGQTIAEHLELRDGVEAVPTRNGIYTLVRLPQTGRWVDTMMYGLNGDQLDAGETAFLERFDGLDRPFRIHMTAQAPAENTVLTIRSGGEEIRQLLEGTDPEEIEAEVSSGTVSLSASNTVLILDYQTEEKAS